MAVVEKTQGGAVYVRPLDTRIAAGDRIEVPDQDVLEHLTGTRDDFRVVDGGQPDVMPREEDEPPDGSAEDSDGFDVDAWLEQDYTERADRVRSGDVDDHLEAIADAERSDTVLDAIGERRTELETETEAEAED